MTVNIPRGYSLTRRLLFYLDTYGDPHSKTNPMRPLSKTEEMTRVIRWRTIVGLFQRRHNAHLHGG